MEIMPVARTADVRSESHNCKLSFLFDLYRIGIHSNSSRFLNTGLRSLNIMRVLYSGFPCRVYATVTYGSAESGSVA